MMDMDRLYEKYLRESANHLPEPGMTQAEFTEMAGAALAGMEHVELNEGPTCEGFMYYQLHREDGLQVCDVPFYGVAASSEKALTMLFSRMVSQVLTGGRTRFQVRLYAHDLQARSLFSMMQFGYMAETGMYRMEPELAVPAGCSIRTLDKAEIDQRWTEIWALTAAIIRHLQQPPVCYPGCEFTEEVYRSFYMDDETRLHAAFSPEGQLIGIIETNSESAFFTGRRWPSANVGEVYVLPAYRGTGLAGQLLSYAAACEQARGTACLWVEHGTANPCARRFWGKYFSTWQYELDRLIEPIPGE